MRFHEAAAHLEFARLCLARHDPAQARIHWTKAKAMIERMGYHRRDGEVAELAARLDAASLRG